MKDRTHRLQLWRRKGKPSIDWGKPGVAWAQRGGWPDSLQWQHHKQRHQSLVECQRKRKERQRWQRFE